MKKFVSVLIFILVASFAVFAQGEMNSKGEPVVKSKDNAPVELKAGESITRGDALVAGTKKVSVEKVLKSPDKYAEQDRCGRGRYCSIVQKGGLLDGNGGQSQRQIGPRHIRRP